MPYWLTGTSSRQNYGDGDALPPVSKMRRSIHGPSHVMHRRPGSTVIRWYASHHRRLFYDEGTPDHGPGFPVSWHGWKK